MSPLAPPKQPLNIISPLNAPLSNPPKQSPPDTPVTGPLTTHLSPRRINHLETFPFPLRLPLPFPSSHFPSTFLLCLVSCALCLCRHLITIPILHTTRIHTGTSIIISPSPRYEPVIAKLPAQPPRTAPLCIASHRITARRILSSGSPAAITYSLLLLLPITPTHRISLTLSHLHALHHGVAVIDIGILCGPV